MNTGTIETGTVNPLLRRIGPRDASRDAGLRAALVLLSGLAGMLFYGVLVGRSVSSWPVADLALMVGITVVGAGAAAAVTLAQRRRNR